MAPAAPLALTMGEPAGVGGELALKAWLARDAEVPPFVALDDPDGLAVLADRLGLAVPVAEVARAAAAIDTWPTALPVLRQVLPAPVVPGRPDPANAPAVLGTIRQAVALTQGGEAAAVVTNPIHKKALYDAGFAHPGHTELLAELAGGGTPVMMLAVPSLRVVPVTVHLALADAIGALDTNRIVTCGRIAAAALTQDFGVAAPRLAVAGLNPHAGEDGALGREEIEVIAPAVAALKAVGIDASGPYPADTLFHADARAAYDAVLCMYHDQALIPLKTVDFRHGVNVTLGLPFVRTSPDHGTALDIAGTGRADPASLIAALKLAAELARRRAATDRAVA